MSTDYRAGIIYGGTPPPPGFTLHSVTLGPPGPVSGCEWYDGGVFAVWTKYPDRLILEVQSPAR